MSKPQLWITALLAATLSASAVRAEEAKPDPASETELRILVDTIRANRRAMIAVNLNLSPEEAEKFWPVYERYDKEISAISDRVAAIVQDYIASFRDLSNDKGLQLMGDYLAAEADRIKVRQTYLPEFAKVVSGRTAARFYQIENKMDAVIRYDLAATIPVVEERDAPAK